MPGDLAGDVQPQSTPASPRPRWWRLVLSPILDLLFPRRAATQLLSASGAGFVGMLLLGSAVLGVAEIGLALWDETLTLEWVPMPATAPTTVTTSMSISVGWQRERHELTAAEVWRNWHTDAAGGWFGWTEIGWLGSALFILALLAAVAWVNLPLVHRAGPVGKSFRRAYRATAAVLWPFTIATLACGTLYLAAKDASAQSLLWPGLWGPEFQLAWSMAVSTALLGLWLRRAVGAADSSVALPYIPPRCEDCGYDLTHRPAEERCPECGADIDASLNPVRSRPGNRWAQRPALMTWLTTCVECLFRPRRFYRKLRLRTVVQPEVGFAAMNYGVIGLGAWLWLATVGMRLGPGLQSVTEVVVVTSIVGGYGMLGLAGGHRVFAALIASVWLWRGELADFAWARKVIAYETSLLWAFCAFWGGNFSLNMVNDEWLSSLLGVPQYASWPLGLPLEALAVLLGTLLLVVAWAVRYGWAYRAIRWSNF